MLALVVLNSTNKVNGVEVSALGEHLHILGIALVNLAALKDLQTYCAVLIIGKERTTARLTYVLNNAAYTDRTVELRAQIDNEVGILKILDVRLATAQVVLNENV